MKIQINKSIRKSSDTTKADLKALTRKHNTVTSWETVDVSVDELVSIIADGVTVRPAIKENGNNDENVTVVTGLMLDFDNSPVSETKAHRMTAQAAFLYYTPSYKEGENEKHRLYFVFDRPRNRQDATVILGRLLAMYPKADKLSDVGHLFFGAYDKDSVEILNINATLPTDNFCVESIPEPTKKAATGGKTTQPASTSESVADGLRARVLAWIGKEIWNNICDSEDIDKLYCLDNHRFEKQRHGKGFQAKWHGHRPEDTEKTTGSGFLVFWIDAGLPPIWENQALGMNGTFIEYWHYYGNNRYNRNWGSIEYEQDPKRTTFKAVVDHIAHHFGIPRFDWDAAKKELSEKRNKRDFTGLDEIIKEYTFEIKDGGADLFVYYDAVDRLWRIKPSINQMWRHCIKPLLIEHGEDAETLENPKVASQYKSRLSGSSHFPSITKIDFDDMRDKEWLPMKNGEFNPITKEFKEYDHRLYNQHRHRVPYAKQERTPEIDLFEEWLRWTYKDELTRTAIVDWLALNATGFANQTQVMMCLWGCPKTGKSVVLSLINSMLGSLAVTMKSYNLSNQDKFTFQELDGVYALTIDEFHTNQQGWNNLKELTGSYEPYIKVEKKGMQSYKTKFRGAITTASQDSFTIPNANDGGITRRIVPIQHRTSLVNPQYEEVDYLFKQTEYYNPIFLWLINNIDVKAALKRIKDYANNNEVKDSMLNILIEQDDVLGFIKDELIFTDNPTDIVSNSDLQVRFEAYLQTERLQHLTDKDKNRINKISQYIREKARIPLNKIKWSLCPEAGKNERITVDGKQIRGLRGVKFTVSVEPGLDKF